MPHARSEPGPERRTLLKRRTGDPKPRSSLAAANDSVEVDAASWTKVGWSPPHNAGLACCCASRGRSDAGITKTPPKSM